MCSIKFNAIILISLIVIQAKGSTGLTQCLFAKDVCPNQYIQFWLYKNDTHEPLLLDPLRLEATYFQPLLPLKILLHGYIGDRDLSPNEEVRPVLLQTQHVNVVSIDYSVLVQRPCYLPWAVKNAPIVAKCLAQFINNLIANDIYVNEDIHLIGFSLGAQIAGLTTNYLPNKLHRITGLDPARPGFMKTDKSRKLDSSDATFVDVIHTDLFVFGTDEASGHVDFYPNYRLLNQPGCNPIKFTDLCNHFRAPAYYAESISSKWNFWSYACGNTLEFELENCYNYAHLPQVLMGYFTPENANGSYFLSTNSLAPYGRGPIEITEELRARQKFRKFRLFQWA